MLGKSSTSWRFFSSAWPDINEAAIFNWVSLRVRLATKTMVNPCQPGSAFSACDHIPRNGCYAGAMSRRPSYPQVQYDQRVKGTCEWIALASVCRTLQRYVPPLTLYGRQS